MQIRTRKGFAIGKMTKGKQQQKKMLKNKGDNNEDRGRRARSVLGGQDPFKISGPHNLRAELLPGIPNDIVLQVIAPKVSVRDTNMLSLVSTSWREAIQSPWVYDALIHDSHSKETFAILSFHFSSKKTGTIRLYSLHGSSIYDLPPVPYPEANLYQLKCIPLDGKIYMWRRSSPRQSCWEMFVLDLVGHKQWKQCKRIQAASRCFAAGVLDGRIYVLGTHNLGECVNTCQVYDPKADSWSSMAELIPYRLGDQVAAIGGELFFYGGREYIKTRRTMSGISSRYVVAYNPVKNQWRNLGHFQGEMDKNPWPRAFVAQGKFHTMTFDGIDVYDMDSNSWSSLHSFSDPRYNHELSIWALGDEIVTLSKRRCPASPNHCFSQSTGFGKKNGTFYFKAVGGLRLRSDLESLNRGPREFDMLLMEL